MWKIAAVCFLAALLVIVENAPSRCKQSPRRYGNVCLLPQEVGPCLALIQRFFYNTTSEMCEQFNYGGCQGNKNNFVTLDQCEQKCNGTDNTCVLPPETGPCKALFQRYFYNATSSMCEEFVYGGCAGNENNFETVEACEQRCKYEIPQPYPPKQP